MPDIDDFRLFVAVAQSGSFAAGAEALRISPSLASRRIASLEETMGARLLRRSTRRVQLTDAGARFFRWAEQTIASYEDISGEIGMQAQEPVGTVRIAANDYMGPRYLLDAVTRFREQHPRVRLVLSLQEDPIAAIKLGYDIAIHVGPMPEETLVGRRIHTYRRLICAAPDYLASHGTPTSPDDLERHNCLVHSLNDTQRWTFRNQEGAFVTRDVGSVIETNSYPALLNLAIRRLGLIRIADMMAAPAIARGDLQEVLADFRSVDPDGRDPAVWLTYAERPRLPSVRLMADYLLETLKALSEPATD
ncbi:LysR family transcriptional regulator [Xanthobacter sp. KR7-65]|uniref:LysR family transcriptional regulator n=1 Tax=Xanthobacter sp. KR7-65 TaxID=3156612 RepID=UPI0032B4F6AF